MRIRAQIYIDKYIVKYLVLLLNVVVRLLGKILRINHRLDRKFDRIAISKYKGMGSIIQSTPLIQTLKKNHPDVRIIYVSSISNKAILKEMEDIIDEVILLDDRSLIKLILSFPRFLYRIISIRAQIWIDLEIYSHTSSLLTTLSMATNRFGYYIRSANYRKGIYTHMMYYNVQVPISETYLQMARLIKKGTEVKELFPLKGEKYEHEVLSGQSYILINPNASDLRVERRWPANSYVALIEQLLLKYPSQKIVLIGSPSERPYVESICRHIQEEDNLINLAGKTSIAQLIHLIAHCDLMISNDSGPMHIAFSTGNKVVALFGPCHPAQYGHYKNAYVIYHPMYCSPCVHEFEIAPCNGNNVCMKKISLSEVLQGVEHVKSGNFTGFNQDTISFQYTGDVLGKVER